MKKQILCAALAFIGVSALAAPLFEPFNYDPSVINLIGQTSPDGITWAQAGKPVDLTNQPTIFPGSLSYSGLSPSSGNSVQLGDYGASARYSFPSAVNSGTIYYSFILKVTDITGMSASGVFWAGFNNSIGSQTTTPSIVQTRIVTRAATQDGVAGFQVGLDKASGGAANFQFATNVFFTNDVIFIVASYTYNDGSSTDDQSRLWVNPDPASFGSDTPPAYTVAVTAGNDATTIRSFVLFNRNAAEPKQMIVDELLVSTNWADVTPLETTMDFTTQPHSQIVVPGVNTFFDVSAYRAQSYQWQHDNVDIPGATNTTLLINNAQAALVGSYQAIASNPSVTKTSLVATLTVTNGTFPVLTPLWSIEPNSRPYVTTFTSGTPLQQSIAYNAVSNQVIIVSRTNTASGETINVLDADTGEFLYEMNTNGIEGVIGGGISPLTMLAVADDGSVYGASATGNGNNDSYKLYRWANSDSNTLPVKIYGDGDPAYQTTAFRWGDTLDVRGTGMNTELLVDSSSLWATVFKPLDDSLTAFYTNPFTNDYADGTIGRSLQWGADDTTFWEKRKGDRLQISTILPPDSDPINGGSVVVAQNNNYPSSIGPVGVSLASNLLAGIDFALSDSAPDTLDFYDISDFDNPILLGKYDFPATQFPNVNYLGQVIFAGSRVFAVDGNNGVVAFAITNAPVSSPELTVSFSGGQVTISWPTSASGFTLESTTSLSPASWTEDTTEVIQQGGFNTVTEDAGTGTKFYRLQQ